MSKWYSVDLGNGRDSNVIMSKIHDSFIPLFSLSGINKDIAVFSKYDLGKNIVTAYFTPDANDLAKAFNASECEKPSSDKITLVAGDQSSFKRFFPDSFM